MAPIGFGTAFLWSVSLCSVAALPNPPSAHIEKRQLNAVVPSPSPSPSPGTGGSLLGGLPFLGGGSNPLSGVINGLPPLGGVPNPLTGIANPLPLVGSGVNPVASLTSGLPLVGGGLNPVSSLTSGLPFVGGGVNPVSSLTSGLPLGGGSAGANPVLPLTSDVPLIGGSNPLSGVTTNLPLGGGGGSNSLPGVTNSLPLLGGTPNPLTGATNILTPIGSGLGPVSSLASGLTGVVPSVASTASNALGGLPIIGSVSSAAPNAVSSATNNLPVIGGALPNLNPAAITGIPGTDPVGAFSISVIATLLALLKKDPLSLFAPSSPVPALVKRDVPELAERDMEERLLAKRQVPGLSFPGLPSLSGGVPGVGIGSLPASGFPGVSPDLAFLVGSIAKNIAIPGGNGLGAVTSSIISVLNNVVPNFLFQLPVVQDSVSTFGVLQLLASINPGKFSVLASLDSLSSLQQSARALPSGDLTFIKTLPLSSDPSNLITTITSLAENILSLPGNVTNLKASVSVLALRNLGLAVSGL